MKKRMNTLLVCTAAAMVTAGLISGCSGGTADSGNKETAKQEADAASTAVGQKADKAPEGEKVTVTFWSAAAKKDFEDKIIAAFMEENPDVEIVPTYYSTDDTKANLKVAASSGTLPDMWTNWGGSLASYYPANGLTYDFTEYAKGHGWEDKYLASALELCTLEGQLCGIPQSISMMPIWYRKDIFEKYELEVPKTFEEMEAVCATLKGAVGK